MGLDIKQKHQQGSAERGKRGKGKRTHKQGKSLESERRERQKKKEKAPKSLRKKLIEGDKSCRAIAVIWFKAMVRLLEYSRFIQTSQSEDANEKHSKVYKAHNQ